MDGEPDPTLSGPGPGGETPDDPNAVWRRPDATEAVEAASSSTESPTLPAPHGVVGRLTAWVRSWWQDLEFVQMWHVVAVAAILTTAGFGGLDQVEKTPQTFTVGQPFDNNEFTFTVHSASLHKQIVIGTTVVAKEKPGRMYLAVAADVTNDQDYPDAAGRMVKLLNVPDAQNPFTGGKYGPSAYRLSDGTEMGLLQPGLTEKVAIVWSVPNTVAPGATVSVELPYQVFSRGFVIYGEGWVDGNTSATADLVLGEAS